MSMNPSRYEAEDEDFLDREETYVLEKSTNAFVTNVTAKNRRSDKQEQTTNGSRSQQQRSKSTKQHRKQSSNSTKSSKKSSSGTPSMASLIVQAAREKAAAEEQQQRQAAAAVAALSSNSRKGAAATTKAPPPQMQKEAPANAKATSRKGGKSLPGLLQLASISEDGDGGDDDADSLTMADVFPSAFPKNGAGPSSPPGGIYIPVKQEPWNDSVMILHQSFVGTPQPRYMKDIETDDDDKSLTLPDIFPVLSGAPQPPPPKKGKPKTLAGAILEAARKKEAEEKAAAEREAAEKARQAAAKKGKPKGLAAAIIKSAKEKEAAEKAAAAEREAAERQQASAKKGKPKGLAAAIIKSAKEKEAAEKAAAEKAAAERAQQQAPAKKGKPKGLAAAIIKAAREKEEAEKAAQVAPAIKPKPPPKMPVVREEGSHPTKEEELQSPKTQEKAYHLPTYVQRPPGGGEHLQGSDELTMDTAIQSTGNVEPEAQLVNEEEEERRRKMEKKKSKRKKESKSGQTKKKKSRRHLHDDSGKVRQGSPEAFDDQQASLESLQSPRSDVDRSKTESELDAADEEARRERRRRKKEKKEKKERKKKKKKKRSKSERHLAVSGDARADAKRRSKSDSQMKNSADAAAREDTALDYYLSDRQQRPSYISSKSVPDEQQADRVRSDRSAFSDDVDLDAYFRDRKNSGRSSRMSLQSDGTAKQSNVTQKASNVSALGRRREDTNEDRVTFMRQASGHIDNDEPMSDADAAAVRARVRKARAESRRALEGSYDRGSNASIKPQSPRKDTEKLVSSTWSSSRREPLTSKSSKRLASSEYKPPARSSSHRGDAPASPTRLGSTEKMESIGRFDMLDAADAAAEARKGEKKPGPNKPSQSKKKHGGVFKALRFVTPRRKAKHSDVEDTGGTGRTRRRNKSFRPRESPMEINAQNRSVNPPRTRDQEELNEYLNNSKTSADSKAWHNDAMEQVHSPAAVSHSSVELPDGGGFKYALGKPPGGTSRR